MASAAENQLLAQLAVTKAKELATGRRVLLAPETKKGEVADFAKFDTSGGEEQKKSPRSKIQNKDCKCRKGAAFIRGCVEKRRWVISYDSIITLFILVYSYLVLSARF